jgi:hypothetical protein
MVLKILGFVGVAVASLSLSLPASAQASRIRGEITSVDGLNLTVKTRAGTDVVVHLVNGANVATVVKAAMSDIKPDSFVGAAAMPQPDGTLKALEIHIFPPAMRGTGEGSRDFDLQPGSTMTNATVAYEVAATDGQKLTLKYKDGEKTVIVTPGTPVVAMDGGSIADIKAGAGVVVFASGKNADGSVDARALVVGKDGTKPPM